MQESQVYSFVYLLFWSGKEVPIEIWCRSLKAVRKAALWRYRQGRHIGCNVV
jgi:hypothetical protein